MDRFTQFAVTAAAEAMAQSGLDLEREDAARMGCPSPAESAVSAPSRTPVNPARAAALTRSPLLHSHGHLQPGRWAHRHPLRPARDVHRPCGRLRRRQQRGGRRLPPHPGRLRRGHGGRRRGRPPSPPGHGRLHLHERPDHRLRPGPGLHPLRRGAQRLRHGRGRRHPWYWRSWNTPAPAAPQILGEITGYGATCDAYHITAPDPAGTWSAACMEQALADAGVTPEAVDYINAHGTSTPERQRRDCRYPQRCSAATPTG